jgi:chromate transporter
VDALWKLAAVFSYLSLLGFGGGKGIIPQMHADTVDQFHWVTSEQFTQFYTIGKLVPGPTTIFSALIGYSAAGIPGAAVATAAIFATSTLLVIALGLSWKRLSRSPWKQPVLAALAPVVIGLVWASVFSLGKGVFNHPISYVLVGLVVVLSLRTKVQTPLLIALGAAGGLVFLR